MVRKQKPTYKGNIQQCESWNYTRLRIMEKQKGKLAFDTYGRLRNETLLESIVYPSFKFKADMPKTEKKRETSPSQSNLNDKNARRYLIRLANINFGKGDIWATFGWNNGLLPETYEDAKKDVVNFIRRINRKRKKLGLENAKYIYIIAFEEYTRPHFHLLISGGIDRDELERMWGSAIDQTPGA